MVAVVIGLVVIVTIAAAVMAMVAFPRMRGGEELLSPGGRQTIARAGQKTIESSASAAENTAQAARSLRGRVSSAWAPASEFLHEQMDRLESNPASSPKTSVPEGKATNVGRPRTVPPISGPLPEIDHPPANQISLRQPEFDETSPHPRSR